MTKKGETPGFVLAYFAGKQGEKRMKDYFTVNELADHFGVNPKTIYRRLWAKGIPAYKVGRIWRIGKKDIKWLRQ